jgi:hypothetical protein
MTFMPTALAADFCDRNPTHHECSDVGDGGNEGEFTVDIFTGCDDPTRGAWEALSMSGDYFRGELLRIESPPRDRKLKSTLLPANPISRPGRARLAAQNP